MEAQNQLRSQLIQELWNRLILYSTAGHWYWYPEDFNTDKKRLELPLGLVDSTLAQILDRWKYLGITDTSQVTSDDWINVRELVASTVAAGQY